MNIRGMSIYDEYQNARVEGFIPAECEFEVYLIAEIKRLREGYKRIAIDYDFVAIISQGRSKIRPLLNVYANDGNGTVKVTYHQKACLQMMELFEDD
jgi:hypothetical protein